MDQKIHPQDLHYYLERLKRVIFRRYKVMVLTFITTSILIFVFHKSNPKIYEAISKVQYLTASDIVGGDLARLMERLPSFLGGGGGETIDTQIELIRSHAVLKPVLTKLDIISEDMKKQEVHKAIENFQNRLSIEKRGNTNIFIIKVRAATPELASQLANTIALVYKIEELRSKRRKGETVKKFTVEQLEKAKNRIFELKGLNKDLDEVEGLKKRREVLLKRLGEIDEGLNRHLEELKLKKERLLATFIESHPEIMELENHMKAIGEFIELESPDLGLIPEGEIYYVMEPGVNLRTEPTLESPVLFTIEPYRRVGVLSEEFNSQDGIPWCYVVLPDSTHGWVSKHYIQEKLDVMNLMSDRIDLEVSSALRPWADMAVEKLKSRWETSDIDQRINIILSKLKANNIESMDMAFLKTELKANQDIYNTLRQKLSNVEISLGDITSSVVILEDAIPPEAPINKRSYKYIPLALVLAFFMSIIMGFIFESLSGSFEHPEEIERFTKYRVLAAVPNLPSHLSNLYQISITDDKLGKEDKRLSSMYVENYRHLMTNLGIRLNHPEKTSILVTSSLAQEGKSTTTANLAVCYAESDLKTLVVSCNIRHPAIFKLYGINRWMGITDVVNDGLNWREVVQETKIEHLFVIPAGNPASNVPKILRSSRMEELLEEAREEFEVILIDSPPFLVTDSLILATKADGVLLVYSSGETSKSLLERNLRQLEEAKANILGLVMNQRLKTRLGGRRGYYYHYYYPSEGRV